MTKLFEAQTKPATSRPCDDDLLQALVFYFGASEETTIQWIMGMGMDLDLLSEQTEEAAQLYSARNGRVLKE